MARPLLFMDIITLKEARQKALKWYYTGKPCPKGHVSLRSVAKRTCRICQARTGTKIQTMEALETARRNGIQQYFTGLPCNKGHISNRWTHNRSCVECSPNDLKYKGIKASKDFAIKNNNITYTGVKCFKCGGNTRYTANRTCVKCHNVNMVLWRKNNPGKANAIYAKYRAAKLKATPIWVNFKLLEQVYVDCPTGFEVDHIIPLQGKNVRGLHVPWNLQYLTRSDNARKSNKVIIH